MPVLEVKNLYKKYRDTVAVDDVSFTVGKGEIVGLLGPNGAGKTTTIHMLLGITLHNGGTIQYFGKNFSNHREECLQRMNAASAFNTLQGRLTVFENLLVFAELYLVRSPRKKIETLLERFEMSEYASELYWSLSSGQRTRINLVKSLLNDPEIILMDEPTASLDPDIADKTLSLIEQLKHERGLSILYTSHNMAEITRLCDSVIFLDHGKVVAHDTPQNLTKRITKATLRLTVSGNSDALGAHLRAHDQSFQLIGTTIFEISTEENLIPDLLFGLSHLGVAITDIEIKKSTLEDVFLRIARTSI